MSSNCKIGAEDANAPMAMWGYLSLNQAASTEVQIIHYWQV